MGIGWVLVVFKDLKARKAKKGTWGTRVCLALKVRQAPRVYRDLKGYKVPKEIREHKDPQDLRAHKVLSVFQENKDPKALKEMLRILLPAL